MNIWDNSKADIKEIGWENVDRINLASDGLFEDGFTRCVEYID